jgi:8-oxo-dGTP pyrophosphatase MutT (NUDIX family)
VDPGRLDTTPSSLPVRSGPQRIPRPADARHGGLAPWSSNAPSVVTVEDVRHAMRLPRAVRSVTAVAPQVELPSTNPRPAAVLCAVFDEGGQAQVVLTRRSSGLRSHTGEVSFPGGRLDAGEEPLAAALREAHEEVGIEPASVEVIGRLSALSTTLNPAPIYPFVGILPSPPNLRPNPTEVDRAFSVPLAELFDPEVGSEELWPLPDGQMRRIHLFALVGDTVWGATARMLRDLMERVWAARSSFPS